MKKSVFFILTCTIIIYLSACESAKSPITYTPIPTAAEIANSEDTQTQETAVEYDEEIYIGNKNSKKFHRPECRTLPAEENRIEFKRRSDAIDADYSPCGNCRP